MLPYQETGGGGLAPGAKSCAPWRRKFTDPPLLPACFPDTAPRTRCPIRAPPAPAAPRLGIRHRDEKPKGTRREAGLSPQRGPRRICPGLEEVGQRLEELHPSSLHKCLGLGTTVGYQALPAPSAPRFALAAPIWIPLNHESKVDSPGSVK